MFEEHEGKHTLVTTDEHTIRLQLDFSQYVDLFCKKNLSLADFSQQEFDKEFNNLITYLSYFNTGLIYRAMLDEVLATFSPNEAEKIRKSPAISLMHDSFAELLKNSIDAF